MDALDKVMVCVRVPFPTRVFQRENCEVVGSWYTQIKKVYVAELLKTDMQFQH